MDEYCGIPKTHEQSYYTFMWTNFLGHVDIKYAFFIVEKKMQIF